MSISVPYMTYAFNEKIFGRNTLRYFAELKEMKKCSSGGLREFQLEKLRRLLLHANEQTVHYRGMLKDAGLDPRAVTSLDDLSKINFVTKEDMRAHTEGFIARDWQKKLARYATSGSTGHPLIFYLSNERVAANKAAYLMLYDWWGLKVGDREAVLWGSSRDISAYSLAKKVRDRLLGTHLLPAFHMNEETMRRYIDFLRSYRPKYIFGYAHSIYLLARFAKNRGLLLKDAGAKVVFTTAESLQDYQRKLIEEVFGCPVSNCYGGRESGLIAFECPEGKMHLNPSIITEVIVDNRAAMPGEKGEIVITDLDSYGMPFIRYRTGDEGIFGQERRCSCGRTFPVIAQVLGRNTDYIVSPTGEFIHPLALEYIFRELDGVDYFKIVQKKEDELIIDLAVNPKFDKNIESTIKNKIDQVMGAVMKVVFKFIKESDVKTEDKYKFVVSEVIKKYI